MPVYFDHNATAPLEPGVFEAMCGYLGTGFGNPSSLHRAGRVARDAVEAARAQVAALVGAQAAEIVWTSGGTEADNLAIKGCTDGLTPTRVLYGATEHPAVLETAESLRGRGWGVEAIAVDGAGRIEWPAFNAQLERAPLRLVAVMAANNETGVIQDLARVAALAHAHGALLLSDAVQAAGRLDLDFGVGEIDLMSLSAHKIYGPKGIGALVVRSGVELSAQLHGGGQERGLRGGTENVAAIVGFGAAAERARAEREQRNRQLGALRERLETGLRQIPVPLPGITLFGAGAPRVANTCQFALPGWQGEALLMALDRGGFAVSSGSACASGSGEPSHVLLAMGQPWEIAYGAIRVSFGINNTADEVDRFLVALAELSTAAAAAA